jgi:hypothetical protein
LDLVVQDNLIQYLNHIHSQEQELLVVILKCMLPQMDLFLLLVVHGECLQEAVAVLLEVMVI